MIEAAVLAVDEAADLALLDVETDLSAVALDWLEEDPPVGSDVIALGYPEVLAERGGGATVTAGLVSRVFTSDSIHYLQTDAALNPGNSGGPLIDRCGRLVGINVAKEFEAEGTGYAVSSRYARASIERMLNDPDSYQPTAAFLVLKVGDCVAFAGNQVEYAACSESHDAKVVAVLSVPGGDRFPGEDTIFSFADGRCPLRAESYAYPTRATWDLGDRAIACLDEDR
jgi:S1-C subfamily serine protease